jgi:hypothetical protein
MAFKNSEFITKRVILNASTVNVNLPVIKLIPLLVALLDQNTSGLARSHLKYELQNQFRLHFDPS